MNSTQSHTNTHTGTSAGTLPDSYTEAHSESHPGGIKEKVASVFRSPAVKKHDKVLSESVDHIVAQGSSAGNYPDLPDHPRLSSEVNTTALSDHDKAKLLKEERNANAPTGNFVLADAKPALVSQGYGEYYGAKAATQNRT
ncbi:hypothetical protein NKR19_g1933 [Coniochaeta hoffmannii]|uniref:Uncharacterized protein n=1 Tax=Coniochaeta hoffmannii TaxID=91930 RepID=A0AA38W0A4_9PEZI|nr:hypothetical protein NKR19_g1933 [Coniochaeta hoffmannii]